MSLNSEPSFPIATSCPAALQAEIIQGDCCASLRALPAESVNCVVTSPPYYQLRCYGVEGQIGLEATPEAYIERMVGVFREVWRVLRRDGTLWLNMGDCYASAWPSRRRNVVGAGSLPNGKREARPPRMGAGLKEKDLVGMPWRLALALQADGWYLRSDIIWHKPNACPDGARDRPSSAHEYLFLLTKSKRYFYDRDAIREPTGNEMSWEEYAAKTAPGASWASGGIEKHAAKNKRDGGKSHPLGRNKRSVWAIPQNRSGVAHFATFPPALVEPCVKAGCPAGGTVLDPFGGSGTTAEVAIRLGRSAVLLELKPAYCQLAWQRLVNLPPPLPAHHVLMLVGSPPDRDQPQ
jgi:DNA modification methylase